MSFDNEASNRDNDAVLDADENEACADWYHQWAYQQWLLQRERQLFAPPCRCWVCNGERKDRGL